MSDRFQFYDIKLLSKATSPEDLIIRDIYSRYCNTIRNYTFKSQFWSTFYMVTPGLIKQFKLQAIQHVKSIKKNNGYLYRLVANHQKTFYYVQFDFESFPLIEEKIKVMGAIRDLAQEISCKDSLEFDATCLYLLYFYGVLANPTSNWITMDYLTNGNKYHAYGTLFPDILESMKKCGHGHKLR